MRALISVLLGKVGSFQLGRRLGTGVGMLAGDLAALEPDDRHGREFWDRPIRGLAGRGGALPTETRQFVIIQ